MARILLVINFFVVLTYSMFCYSEAIYLPELQKNPANDVTVTRLAGDENATQFLVVIKKEVKPHIHASHSESIYVIDGSGEMRLGSENFAVKKGDFVFIEQGVVHAVTVTSSQPLRVLSIQAPKFDGSDRVFITE